MKPHEEEWDNPEGFEVTVLGPELDRGIDGPREVLARAAPDMARALLAVVGWDEMQRAMPDVGVLSPIAQVRAALSKAGVLP